MIGYLTPNYPLVAAFRALPATRRRPVDRVSQQIFKTAPKLSDFLNEDEILASKGDLDRPISGVALDSRRVMHGNLFFALPGQRADGNLFIDAAVARGAVAVIAEKLPAVCSARVTYIQVADARRMLARVAQRFYKFPDRSLEVVGVTGSSGKTTVAALTQHLLATDRQRVGLLGSINYDLGNRVVPSYRTTPESLDLYGMLAQMRDTGCRQAVVELSSRGLEQQRALGLHLGVAVFTNLASESPDSLESLEAYFAVKARLFSAATVPAPRSVAINLDDAHGRRLVAEAPVSFKVVTFGETSEAMIRAENIRLSSRGTALTLVWPEGRMEIESSLVGRCNVSNLLAAFAASYALGRDPFVIASRLKSLSGISGRMERVDAGQNFNVLVDYAHTADNLRHALAMAKSVTAGRLLVVFGCGGDRERSKRAAMTAVVQECADVAWATADNPRHEQLLQIFSDMKPGVTAPEQITFVEDRRRAIGLALDAARPGDCVLIAGKGHETFQELADTVVPFDDRQVAREYLAGKR